MEPGFPRAVTIYGTGLIGGSFALALKKQFPGVQVFGVDGPDTLNRARQLGMVDEGNPAKPDLVILATPVGQILELMETFPPGDALILDVGSTKVEICKKAAKRGLAFVGGHPMTGSERSGPDSASADLFSGAPFFLCTVQTTPVGAIEKLSHLVRAIGANAVFLSPEDHDRIVAQISHLPQILSTLLVDHSSENLQFAGPGVKSMTRLAASPFHVWRDIFETSGSLPHEVRAFVERMRSVLEALEGGDLETIQKVFERANRSSSSSTIGGGV